jgi:type I restriction enzyme S subunit
MNDLWTIPQSWCWVEFSDLGEIFSGGTPSTKEPSYWGDEIGWISPSDLTGYNKKTISRGAKSITKHGLQNSSARLMPAGSVHFSSRAPIGYVVISSDPVSTNQGFKSIVPTEGIFNEYLYYFLKSAKSLAENRASGTTFRELSGSAFKRMPFPLPPTAEQHRIVDKIEELLSELDKGVESLEIARSRLQVYRNAVLKNAFEGKLSANWRDQNKDAGRHRSHSSSWSSLEINFAFEKSTPSGRTFPPEMKGMPWSWYLGL